ncbi:MAG: 16S rRNA (uracil(1498)-N(3))-methyltransferase [Clostridia bacterium]|nr:16S rRNA (uracil(1498)-N(3))-methyltransferase [Clostridia bacterium]
MPRFFIAKENIQAKEDDTLAYITGEDSFHIARALRMAVGDVLTVCDSDGCEYDGTLEKIRDDVCAVRLENRRSAKGEPPVFITLYMAYPKGDKLETVIQKAVELGASRIVPFESSRCIKRPKADKVEEKTRRLAKIATEAAKQCGRGRLPEVCRPMTYTEMLAHAKEDDLALFCYEGEGTKNIRAILEEAHSPKTISVIVGSEGGFSPEEASAAQACGMIMTGLGERILRCETAPDYALSAISYQFELSN